MSARRPYQRVVLKLSGNALGSDSTQPISQDRVAYVASELKKGWEICPQLAVVLGGGNIMRGARFRPEGPARVRADHCGMLATIINALVMQDGLELAGVPCTVLSARPVEEMVERFTAARCVAELERGHIVLLAGGTGNPFFTTDTAAVLRAVQIGADIVLKATRVEGVYSADPETDPTAQLYTELDCEQVLRDGLRVIDLTAATLCAEYGMEMRVFNFNIEDNIRRALQRAPVGTLIRSGKNAR